MEIEVFRKQEMIIIEKLLTSIKVLIFILLALMQQRQRGIKMSPSTKIHFIRSLFNYFTHVLNIQGQEQCIEKSRNSIMCIHGINKNAV
jgi:hypothetical protein